MSDSSFVKYRNKTNMKKSKSNNSLDEVGDVAEKKIDSLEKLSAGEHIVISVDAKNYCHAIVDAIDVEKNILDVIYYDDAQIQCALDDYMVNSKCERPLVEPSAVGDAESNNKPEINEKSPKSKEKRKFKWRKAKSKDENNEKAKNNDADEHKSTEGEKESDKENDSLKKYDCRVSGVKKSTICVDLAKVEIYKVQYNETEKILTKEETLEKARRLVGQHKYNVFLNNDEHFAIYVKTGKAAKLFVLNPNEITAKNLIGKDISEKIVTNLAQEGGQILLVNTAKHIATKFPRSAISAGLPAAAEVAGSMIGVTVEGFSMSYDIYQKHKEYKEGKLTDLKFKKYIARRVTRGTMGVAGGVAGGIIGQLVIPVPVVGAVVGSLVGGIVGAAAGQGEGILIAELIEKIDNKIKDSKEKKMAKSTNETFEMKELSSKETLIPEEEEKSDKEKDSTIPEEESTDLNKEDAAKVSISNMNNLQSEEVKYHVIDKLVLKFDKDLLKPENFAHLDDINLTTINPEEINLLNHDGKVLLENANKYINDDDYEIYLLNDSKEVTKLNVQNVLNPESLKRQSIENFSADSLPSDINVFFRIEE